MGVLISMTGSGSGQLTPKRLRGLKADLQVTDWEKAVVH